MSGQRRFNEPVGDDHVSLAARPTKKKLCLLYACFSVLHLVLYLSGMQSDDDTFIFQFFAIFSIKIHNFVSWWGEIAKFCYWVLMENWYTTVYYSTIHIQKF